MGVQEHLHQLGVLQEEDVGGPADQRVDAGPADGEADPHSVQALLAHSLQNVPHHLAVHLLPKSAIAYRGSLAFMKSGWISTLADS
jgi:hypothetical protein